MANETKKGRKATPKKNWKGQPTEGELLLSDANKASVWPWMVRPEGSQWAVYAMGPLREAGVESEKIRVALCDHRELARDIVTDRQIAEAATNWMGLMHKTFARVFMGEEAKEYRQAWWRASVPFEDEAKLEKALERTPLEWTPPPSFEDESEVPPC